MNKILICLLAVSSTFLITKFSYAYEAWYRGEPFSAIKTTIDQGETVQSMLMLSPEGYREEVSPNGLDKIVYVTNFKQEKTWMLVPRRNIYIEVESMMGGPESGFNKSTLFNSKPCVGFDRSRKVNDHQGRYRRYEEWHCTSLRLNSSLSQWFDPETNMVVRERRPTGSDITIDDIKFERLSKTLFQIPEGYRKGDTADVLKALR